MLAAALLLAGCDTDRRIAADAGLPPAPAFDAAWRISTHNSYWVDRGVPGDLFASGTGERLADQLLVDHARGVEIDIHKDPATPGAFAVYHTTPGNTLCDSLPGCLAMLRAFHRTLPEHEALHVTLELKELTSSLFDAAHTVADLDRVLGDELGDLLYRPADLMARCPGAATLADCTRAAGWPETREMRGRFVISVLGNWSGLPGAQATVDYVDYATAGDVRNRAAFPMASSWQLDRDAISGLVHDLVTQDGLDRAFAQAAFLQIEDIADPRAAPFVARHGLVRADGAAGAADQEARAALGMQLLQSDTPWIQADDHGPAQPFRPFAPGFDAEVLREPGGRLALVPAGVPGRLFAYVKEDPTASVAWETAASSGMDTTRVGCLRAASALGTDDGAVSVCRLKPAEAPGKDAERVVVTVTTCQQGVCVVEDHVSQDPAAEGPGDLLRLELSPGPDGGTCVQARSATAADVDLTPRWADLGAPVCLPLPLPYVGIATPSAGWFFGTRREAAGSVADLRAAHFDGVVAEQNGAAPPAPASLVEASSP